MQGLKFELKPIKKIAFYNKKNNQTSCSPHLNLITTIHPGPNEFGGLAFF